MLGRPEVEELVWQWRLGEAGRKRGDFFLIPCEESCCPRPKLPRSSQYRRIFEIQILMGSSRNDLRRYRIVSLGRESRTKSLRMGRRGGSVQYALMVDSCYASEEEEGPWRCVAVCLGQ
jgi:hypothetical protein